tara:strand:+ start:432 stop:1214 length:783 start_codon:yes stop_codon:yes gene_type:complete
MNYQNHLITFITLSTLLSIGSCSLKNNEYNESNFIIKDFDLKQNKPNGDIYWSIKSKKAQYNQNINNITSFNPIVKIFEEGVPKYIISSKRLLVKENGDNINFIENVIVKDIQEGRTRIEGNEMIWIPADYQLQFNEQAYIYRFNQSINTLKLKTSNLFWNTNNGKIKSLGKVYAVKYFEDINNNQYMKSENLFGNINKGIINMNKCTYIRSNNISSKSSMCLIKWDPLSNKISHNNYTQEQLYLQSENKLIETTIIIND